jgi:hypothetical protein
MRMTVEKLEFFKELSSILVDKFPGGAIFAISDQEKIIWKAASKVFDLHDFDIGTRLRLDGAPYQAFSSGRPAEEKVPRQIYGMRLFMNAIPVFNEERTVGSAILILPRLHPIARSFGDFAPLMADMFPDGAFLYMTDLEKIAYRQPSRKFDMPDLPLGNPLKEGYVAYRAIKTGKLAIEQVDASVHGVPVIIMSNPCFDEDDNTKVVATFNIALPKHTAMNLRSISSNVTKGLEEVSAVIQELAASSSQINVNEQELNQDIQEVNRLADNISEVLVFIKQIADETKMLGLNAAIEAARAGDSGRGFGVVADEIRKLSDESRQTVVSIRDLINNIKLNTGNTAQKSQVNLLASEEQAAATEEITASIEEIRSMAESLDKIAKEM